MVQYLAPLSEKKVHASQEVLKKADLIGRCYEVFGL
jgi:hypothetical protein